MSCYHPLLGIWYGSFTESGKRLYKICSQKDPSKNLGELDQIPIPCGQCIGCRLDYSRKWADRMFLELQSSGKAVFVTLTYDDDHLPENGSVSVRDCQLFLKRLRKHFGEVKIRFYLASEYGPLNGRPHYHVILFGIGLDDLCDVNADKHGKNKIGQPYYISPLLSQIWPLGFSLISDVSYDTMAYVSRYVTKKLTGKDRIVYAADNIDPEFSLMSRKPGIGLPYLYDHPDCLDFVEIPVTDGRKARKLQIPKIFLDRLDLPEYEKSPNPFYDPVRFLEMKNQRVRLAEDRMLLRLQQDPDLDYLTLLHYDEMYKKKVIAGKGHKRYNLLARNNIDENRIISVKRNSQKGGDSD